ncbi:MAG: Rrf2 family transcriptional regulator [Oscillospiraceae bacterium]|jgi:Rrf2 family protein|nr:Rrf2 family transcriptional regulator [Oscillospiraceae bacterium]
MKISTKGRYSLRVMLDLALHINDGYVPLRDIAQRQGITVKYLEQIIGILQKAGFLLSLRGNSGGYQLARAASDYIVGDILRATEGSLAPLACLDSADCSAASRCTTKRFWDGLASVITQYVDCYTLQDLVDMEKQNMELDYCI